MYTKYVQRRDELGMSDYAVAQEAGIGGSTFSDWKSGRSKPKMEKLAKIAKVLNVPLEYFLEDKS